MSWTSDLASGLGIPGAATTLAAAMYAACAAAEKAARPEALTDIGRIVGNQIWYRSVSPSVIIRRMFVWTFGDRHLTWKCLRRSVTATVGFSAVFFSLFLAHDAGLRQHVGQFVVAHPFYTVAEYMIVGVAADYVALAKTRLLIKLTGSNFAWRLLLIPADILLSTLISFVFLIALIVGAAALSNVVDYIGWCGGLDKKACQTDDVGLNLGYMTVMLGCSTLLTSIWTILVLLSTTVLKLLVPLQRFTGWFFDVDRHPVKAIGIVAAALVMIAGFIWSVARAVI